MSQKPIFLLVILFVCPALSLAENSIRVDFGAIPVSQPSMLGFLLGVKAGVTPVLPIEALAPALWKGSTTQLGTFPEQTGARLEFALGNAWGYPWNSFNSPCNPGFVSPKVSSGGTPTSNWIAPYENLENWDACVSTVAKTLGNLNYENFDFDIWNEPNGAANHRWRRGAGTPSKGNIAQGQFWLAKETDPNGNVVIDDSSVDSSFFDPNCQMNVNSKDSICNLARLYVRTYQDLLSIYGSNFRLGGPSVNARANENYTLTFLGYIQKLDPSIHLGYVSWHEYRGSWAGTTRYNPMVEMANYLNQVRTDVQNQYGNLVGTRAEIHINETVDVLNSFSPGGMMKYLEQLELGHADFAARGCWGDPQDGGTSTCNNGTVDGMLMPNPTTTSYQLRSPWWVYQNYNGTLANRVPCALSGNNPYLTCMAGKDPTGQNLRVIIGYGVFDTGVTSPTTVQVNLSGLTSANSVPLQIRTIPAVSDAVSELPLQNVFYTGGNDSLNFSVTLKVNEAAVITTAPPAGSMIFTTREMFQGNLGGIPGANVICNSLASKHGLMNGHSWTALIAEEGETLDQRVSSNGPFWNSLYQKVAPSKGALFNDTLLNSISYDETGTLVSSSDTADTWTGSGYWGGGVKKTCSNWTTSSASERGTIGISSDLDYWTTDNENNPNGQSANCSSSFHLYCISQ